MLQREPQVPPAQVALAFEGTGHGVQLEPQLEGSDDETHAPLQMWNPLAQVIPHIPAPSHVAVPFGSVGQGVQLVPQPSVDVSAMHCEPHMWLPGSQVQLHEPPEHDAVAPEGAEHTIPHDPQFIRSFATSAHVPDGQRIVPAGQPLEHAYGLVDDAREQTGVVPLHATPHAPQLALSPSEVSQPFAAS